MAIVNPLNLLTAGTTAFNGKPACKSDDEFNAGR
jgi:hypothetical protein